MIINQVNNDFILKRDLATIIVGAITGAICLGITVLFIVLMGKWGYDPIAFFIVIVSSIDVISLLSAIGLYFTQPSKVLITKDNRIIIKDNKDSEFITYIDKVKIRLYKEEMMNSNIIFIILMGIIPGASLFYCLGKYKLSFTIGLKIYQFRYSSPRILSKLFSSLNKNTLYNIDNNENYISENIKTWDRNIKPRKFAYKLATLLLVIYIAIISLSVIALSTIPRMDSHYAKGLGTEKKPYIIETSSQFDYFSSLVNKGYYNEHYFFALNDNIDLEGKKIIPTGIKDEEYFSSYFDGRGYVIRNFKVIGAMKIAGLFGLNKGEIKNLGVEDFLIDVVGAPIKNKGNWDVYAGGLAAGNVGVIENCYVANGEVIVSDTVIPNVGGFVGDNNGTITNSYSSSNVKASSSRGTVIAGGFDGGGYNSYINNCLVVGNVEANFLNSYNDEEQSRASSFSNLWNIETSYSYEGQKITRTFGEPVMTITESYNPPANTCSINQLNDEGFYINILTWSEEIWDFNDLDFINGKMPKLKIKN